MIRSVGHVSCGRGVHRLWILIGVLVLMIGVAVYVTDRRADRVYFLPRGLAHLHDLPSVFGAASDNLPTFTHALALTLITAGVLMVGKRGGLAVALGWCATDVAFEVGQHRRIAPWLASHLPDWFGGIPFLENTSAYFTAGTFDPRDVISIVLGSVLAYLTIVVTCSKGTAPWFSTTCHAGRSASCWSSR